MQQLINDIKSGEFKKVYLLYGEEDYLRKQYKDKLRAALTTGEDDMNYVYFEGKDIQAGQVIDFAETMPFLAERRVVFIENSGWFKSGGDAMAEYLPTQCDTTVICFIETEIDKRSKLFKAVTEKGYAAEFAKQNEETLFKWIAGKCKAEGKQIRREDISFFIEKTGSEMDNMARELEKLFCYCLEKNVITSADIDDICTTKIESHIFAMIDAIAENKQRVALDKYYELLANKEAPMYILYMIGRHCNNLLMTKELRLKGLDNRAIAERTKQKDFVVRKQANQASRFGAADLRAAVETCVKAETDVKTGLMSDRLAVETVILTALKHE